MNLENYILPLTPSDVLLCNGFKPFLSVLVESHYQYWLLILTPSDLAARILAMPELKGRGFKFHYPARGRKHEWFRELRQRSLSSNSITPQGDGNLDHPDVAAVAALGSNSITPQGDGNLEALATNCFLQVQIPLPRKGTETLEIHTSTQPQRLGSNSITPQGDGNKLHLGKKLVT